jgi:hypothetical protein
MSLVAPTGTVSQTASEISRRLTALEKEVALLKRRRKAGKGGKDWWRALAGRFDGDSIYTEISKEGRKWRVSQQKIGRAAGKSKSGRSGGAHS